MKTIVVLGLVASLMMAAPAFAYTAGTDELCGPDGPGAYKRPGGFCDVALGKGSLSLPTTGAPASGPALGMTVEVEEPEEDDCLCAAGV